MNDPEDFLTRWSRRKREAADEPNPSPDPPRPEQTDDAPETGRDADGSSPQQPAAHSDASEPAFDLSTLPSIESITAETDIRAFFAPGVPAELKLAALRRAWVTDPKVRDFVGLADYDWDFHTPGAIPGFGPLAMTDDLRREVARIVGDWQGDEAAATPAPRSGPEPSATEPNTAEPNATEPNPEPEAAQSAVASNSGAQDQVELIGSTATSHRSEASVAVRQDQSNPDDFALPTRRSHGRALPE